MITPQEAGKVTPEETEALEAAEKKVDAVLREGYRNGRAAHVREDAMPPPGRVRDELLRRYRNAGWTAAERNSAADPRGTCEARTWWEFAATSRPPQVGFECERDATGR